MGREALLMRLALGRSFDVPPDWESLRNGFERDQSSSELEPLYNCASTTTRIQHGQTYGYNGRPLNRLSNTFNENQANAQNAILRIALAQVAQVSKESEAEVLEKGVEELIRGKDNGQIFEQRFSSSFDDSNTRTAIEKLLDVASWCINSINCRIITFESYNSLCFTQLCQRDYLQLGPLNFFFGAWSTCIFLRSFELIPHALANLILPTQSMDEDYVLSRGLARVIYDSVVNTVIRAQCLQLISIRQVPSWRFLALAMIAHVFQNILHPIILVEMTILFGETASIARLLALPHDHVLSRNSLRVFYKAPAWIHQPYMRIRQACLDILKRTQIKPNTTKVSEVVMQPGLTGSKITIRAWEYIVEGWQCQMPALLASILLIPLTSLVTRLTAMAFLPGSGNSLSGISGVYPLCQGVIGTVRYGTLNSYWNKVGLCFGLQMSAIGIASVARASFVYRVAARASTT